MKVLFITPYLDQAASSRYRVYQYLPSLHALGIEATVRPFVDQRRFFDLVYRQGFLPQKTLWTIRSTIRRFLDIPNANDFDVIFIQREALPFGSAWVEKLLFAKEKPILYDFDDAVYLPNFSQANQRLKWLKRPQKTGEIIRLSTHVIAGNDYLRDYAQQFDRPVTVIPTSIDTDLYTLRKDHNPTSSPVTIGWIGSHTTLPYLKILDHVFQRLAQTYAIQVRVIGGQVQIPQVQVDCRDWKAENEISDLHSLDIGVMPMPDNEWTRGKCGLKALQYMAAGLPAVVSPVGVNSQIIEHGKNGFLAASEQDWIESLSRLIEDAGLRKQLGLAGQRTVAERYSLKTNAPRLASLFHTVLHSSQAPQP